jgi:hypothetical protein
MISWTVVCIYIHKIYSSTAVKTVKLQDGDQTFGGTPSCNHQICMELKESAPARRPSSAPILDCAQHGNSALGSTACHRKKPSSIGPVFLTFGGALVLTSEQNKQNKFSFTVL